jgi:hypothetical protein
MRAQSPAHTFLKNPHRRASDTRAAGRRRPFFIASPKEDTPSTVSAGIDLSKEPPGLPEASQTPYGVGHPSAQAGGVAAGMQAHAVMSTLKVRGWVAKFARCRSDGPDEPATQLSCQGGHLLEVGHDGVSPPLRHLLPPSPAACLSSPATSPPSPALTTLPRRRPSAWAGPRTRPPLRPLALSLTLTWR